MTEEEAVQEAKARWPERMSPAKCTEGFAKVFNRLCVVGIRTFLCRQGEWQEVDFETKGVGNTFEDAFKSAKRGGK